jgi:hypothetical protein
MPILSDSSQCRQLSELFLKYLLIYFAILMELIVGVLMPLYTHLNILMADSFIGGNRLPRENHHPFSDLPHVSSTNKTDRHDMTEVLMKMALSTL